MQRTPAPRWPDGVAVGHGDVVIEVAVSVEVRPRRPVGRPVDGDVHRLGDVGEVAVALVSREARVVQSGEEHVGPAVVVGDGHGAGEGGHEAVAEGGVAEALDGRVSA
jgi:hypothetical protein